MKRGAFPYNLQVVAKQLGLDTHAPPLRSFVNYVVEVLTILEAQIDELAEAEDARVADLAARLEARRKYSDGQADKIVELEIALLKATKPESDELADEEPK